MEELSKNLKAALKTDVKIDSESQSEAGAEAACSFEEKCVRNFMKEYQQKPFPPFYSKVPHNDELMKGKIREEARELLLMKKSKDLFDHDELTDLYMTLEKHASPPFSGEPNEEKFMNYTDFKNVVSSLNEKSKKLLTPKVFMKFLTDDPYGRVSVTTLFNYVMRKTWLKQTRIGLSMYDDNGKGYIKESGLECYINELIPTLVQLNGLDQSFLPFYVCTAVRKFFFFLDQNRTGRVKILDILCSGFIDDLLDLREEEPPKESNWFSVQSTMKAYGRYLNLDTDHNGMLSKKELLKYVGGSASLTETFVDRVFQECLTFEGEMDYRTYLDFVLAMENRKEPQSIQYFFRILDIDHKGYLNSFDLNFFFKDIKRYMETHYPEPILFEDVKDEIFDMVKPKHSLKITLSDLINSGCGSTVVHILTDFNGFWMYENREASVPEVRKDDGRSSDV